MTKAQSLKVPLRSFAKNLESKLSKDAHITHNHRVRSNEHIVHLEKKLMNDLLTMKNGGVNWVKSPPE